MFKILICGIKDLILLSYIMFFYFYKINIIISIILFLVRGIRGLLGIIFLFFGLEVFLEWNLVFLYNININFLIFLDFYSLLFASFVLYISSSVFIFSRIYIKEDNFIYRFVFLILLFIISILILIFRGNLITVLIGWDGLGLVSFLLVIYYINKSSLGGGLITFLTNRIGDAGLILSISLLFNFREFNIFILGENFFDYYVIFLVILRGITKRAQIPFSAWLPAAIAAPTPVSSLVHSSTLVTAGVYLLIRFNNILVERGLGYYLFLISILTIFISGLRANFEFDLKKIIALSTLSQLSVIFVSLSLGI